MRDVMRLRPCPNSCLLPPSRYVHQARRQRKNQACSPTHGQLGGIAYQEESTQCYSLSDLKAYGSGSAFESKWSLTASSTQSVEQLRQVEDPGVVDVRVPGLEPGRLSAPGPKPGASANSATPACRTILAHGGAETPKPPTNGGAGGSPGTRTRSRLIKSQMLCQLS